MRGNIRLAGKTECAVAQSEQRYWRSIGTLLGVQVYGWNAMLYCTFMEPGGGTFQLSHSVAERILRLPAAQAAQVSDGEGQ